MNEPIAQTSTTLTSNNSQSQHNLNANNYQNYSYSSSPSPPSYPIKNEMSRTNIGAGSVSKNTNYYQASNISPSTTSLSNHNNFNKSNYQNYNTSQAQEPPQPLMTQYLKVPKSDDNFSLGPKYNSTNLIHHPNSEHSSCATNSNPMIQVLRSKLSPTREEMKENHVLRLSSDTNVGILPGYNSNNSRERVNYVGNNSNNLANCERIPSPVSRAQAAISSSRHEISGAKNLIDSSKGVSLHRNPYGDSWTNANTPSPNSNLLSNYNLKRVQQSNYRRDLEIQIEQSRLRKVSELKERRSEMNHPLGGISNSALIYSPSHKHYHQKQTNFGKSYADYMSSKSSVIGKKGPEPPRKLLSPPKNDENSVSNLTRPNNNIQNSPLSQAENMMTKWAQNQSENTMTNRNQNQSENITSNRSQNQNENIASKYAQNQNSCSNPSQFPKSVNLNPFPIQNNNVPQVVQHPPQFQNIPNIYYPPSNLVQYPNYGYQQMYAQPPILAPNYQNYPMYQNPQIFNNGPAAFPQSAKMYTNTQENGSGSGRESRMRNEKTDDFYDIFHKSSSGQKIYKKLESNIRDLGEMEKIDVDESLFRHHIWQTSDQLPSTELKSAVYKTELKKQIVEKTRMTMIEKAKEIEEEEKLERSILEYQEKMRKQLEAEQRTIKLKIEGNAHRNHDVMFAPDTLKSHSDFNLTYSPRGSSNSARDKHQKNNFKNLIPKTTPNLKNSNYDDFPMKNLDVDKEEENFNQIEDQRINFNMLPTQIKSSVTNFTQTDENKTEEEINSGSFCEEKVLTGVKSSCRNDLKCLANIQNAIEKERKTMEKILKKNISKLEV